MTMLTFVIILAALAATGMLVISRIRMIQPKRAGSFYVPTGERYQPMLRLLREDEFLFAGKDIVLRRRMMQQRRQLLREYLRCMAKDYGQLLDGIRLIMLQSDRDRPDLVKTLAVSRATFALSLCRIECSLRMHELGIGSVDVSGLVRAMDSLRSAHANLLTPTQITA